MAGQMAAIVANAALAVPVDAQTEPLLRYPVDQRPPVACYEIDWIQGLLLDDATFPVSCPDNLLAICAPLCAPTVIEQQTAPSALLPRPTLKSSPPPKLLPAAVGMRSVPLAGLMALFGGLSLALLRRRIHPGH